MRGVEKLKMSSWNEFLDTRQFEFGSVWLIRDEEIKFPKEERLGIRKMRERRWVVVVSNCSENHHPLCPTVTVAPLTTRTDKMMPMDIPLKAKIDNVAEDCIIKLKQMQPVLKIDLFDCKGLISETSRDELLSTLYLYFGFSQIEEDT